MTQKLSMIREAHTIAKLGKRVEFVKSVQKAIGAKTLVEATQFLGDEESFGVTPEQIADQVANHLADGANSLTQQQFAKLASQFRMELEDSYDETYSNSEWKPLVAAAWQLYLNPNGSHEENEEWDDEAGYDFDDPKHPTYGERMADRGDYERDQQRERQWEENEEANDDRWTVSFWVEHKSYSDGPGREYEDSITVRASTEQEAVAKAKAMKHSGGHAYGFKATKGVSQEDEEAGWPSDESMEDTSELDDFMGSMNGDEREDLNQEMNGPEDKDDLFRDRYNDFPPEDDQFDDEDVGFGDKMEWDERHPEENEEFRTSQQRGSDRDEQFAQDRFDQARAEKRRAVFDRTARRFQQSKPDQEEEEMSQEMRGWEDAKAGKAKAFPTDTEYMKGYDRAMQLGAAKQGEEQEENSKSDGSLLKSLLTQRKEVSKKASEAMKKVEAEGAKAFHEIRMKHEKSPYDTSKNGDEHTAWLKGWQKAAAEHYNPEPVEDPKAKARAKFKKKK